MIVDIDVGNSYAKWRVISNSGEQIIGVQAVGSILKKRRLNLTCQAQIHQARLASVSSNEVATLLQDQFKSEFGVNLRQAVVSSSAGGVKCGYLAPDTLGVDRWLAMVAAYSKYHQPIIVVDAGSAITIDVVSANGLHLGGYILPGLDLARTSLWQGTQKVKAEYTSTSSVELGRSTGDAVNNGVRFSVITSINQLAKNYDGLVVLTGGSAPALELLLNLPMQLIPHLVLDGLAISDVEFRS
ncbi:MAG: type III pantothenate kinase [Porticoccaceae bacterium]|nr:type III pantothenate kinase [Porticoccaceae bacterium]